MKSRKSFLIRIDPKLHEELVAWAEQEFRSVNGQIEFLLREAVARRRGKSARRVDTDATPTPSEDDMA